MNNLTQPAYPVVPLQDNFKRLVVPIPGLSKFEHFALEIYKAKLSNYVVAPLLILLFVFLICALLENL